jgi:hypothetical protein
MFKFILRQIRAIYLIFLITLFALIVYLNFQKYIQLQENILLIFVLILCGLLLSPLFAEINLFGFKIKQQLNDIKNEVQGLASIVTSNIFSSNVNINTDPNFDPRNERTHISKVPPGSLITTNNRQFFWYGKDCKRSLFTTTGVFLSWFSPGEPIKIYEISQDEMNNIPLAGNVTYRPGAKLVKLHNNPKIYAVEKNRYLRLIESRELIGKLYPGGWEYYCLDIIPDAFFTNYIISKPIIDLSDYNVHEQLNSCKTVEDILH